MIERKLEVLGEALNGQAETIESDTSEHKVDFDKLETDEFLEQMFQRFESYSERTKFMDERMKRKRERKKSLREAEDDELKEELNSLLSDEKMDVDDDFEAPVGKEKPKKQRKRKSEAGSKILIDDKNFDTINDEENEEDSPLLLGSVPLSVVGLLFVRMWINLF